MRNSTEQMWSDREGKLFHAVISGVTPMEKGKFFVTLELIETGDFLECEMSNYNHEED